MLLLHLPPPRATFFHFECESPKHHFSIIFPLFCSASGRGCHVASVGVHLCTGPNKAVTGLGTPSPPKPHPPLPFISFTRYNVWESAA